MDAHALKASLPKSVLPYPTGLWNQAKYVFWKVIAPCFTTVQNLLLNLHVIHHSGRQPFVLGSLAPGKSVEDFLHYIESIGFANHFIAWVDDGELLGLRKLDGFEYQYHIRIFDDGEIRGHYEYTPEAHMIWHVKEVGMVDRREDFLGMLGDWIIPAPSVETLNPTRAPQHSAGAR